MPVAEPIEPTPLTTDQVNVGCVPSALPNWSEAMAVKVSPPPTFSVTGVGETAMDVSVWLTVTSTTLVVDPLYGFAIVTVKTYEPAFENVAVLFFAAFVPLALYVTLAGPVADHVYVRTDSPASSAP